jgi:hypothetical protein
MPPSDYLRSRLQHVVAELDHVLGEAYAAANPNVVAAVLISSSIDTAGVLIAIALTEDDRVVPLRRTYAGGLTYGLDEEPTILDIARSDGDGTTATARAEAAGYGLPDGRRPHAPQWRGRHSKPLQLQKMTASTRFSSRRTIASPFASAAIEALVRSLRRPRSNHLVPVV